MTAPKNKAAQALGRLGRGKPKRYSDAEREKRRQRMHAINERKAQANPERRVFVRMADGTTVEYRFTVADHRKLVAEAKKLHMGLPELIRRKRPIVAGCAACGYVHMIDVSIPFVDKKMEQPPPCPNCGTKLARGKGK